MAAAHEERKAAQENVIDQSMQQRDRAVAARKERAALLNARADKAVHEAKKKREEL